MFTAQDVRELRNRTNAGMMDCKKALEECNGDMDKAADYLREKGMAAAAKKSGRIAAEGVVQSYIHMGGKIGVLVEVNCETDFVARSEQFLSFVKDVAMQIAASSPKYVTEAEVPAEEVEKEREIVRVQTLNEGKPENVVDRIVDGRISKFYSEICLLNQPFVKDPSITVNELVNKITLALGEKISIRRFTRYEMGEGIEKRKDDFVNEVLGQIKA